MAKKEANKPAKQPKQGGGKKKAGQGAMFEVAPADMKRPNKPPVLRNIYEKSVAPKLREQLDKKNVMCIPKLERIVVNSCSKDSVANPKVLDNIVTELATITGQKPILTRAKKSIAGFKLREGVPIGACVTLRNKAMYDFLYRLINIALPRVRDFKGVSKKSFDGRGNYTLGLREQIIFPEINHDKIDKIRGMNITIVTTADNNNDARSLLTELGMPFRK